MFHIAKKGLFVSLEGPFEVLFWCLEGPFEVLFGYYGQYLGTMCVYGVCACVLKYCLIKCLHFLFSFAFVHTGTKQNTKQLKSVFCEHKYTTIDKQNRQSTEHASSGASYTVHDY